MRHLDLKRRLEDLELGSDTVAAYLKVKPRHVDAWLAGLRPIPERRLAQIEWVIERRCREIALENSDLPSCEWLDEWQPPDIAAGISETRQALKEFQEHPRSCPVCQARMAFVEKTFGPEQPYPHRPLTERVGQSLIRLYDVFPAWLAPPLLGAIALTAIVGIPGSIVLLIAIMAEPGQAGQHFREGFRVIALASAFGASGGVMFSLVRPFTRPLGVVGEYLTGIASAFGYVLAMLWAWPLLDQEDATPFSFGDPFDVGFLVVASIVFGIAGTWGWRSSGTRD